MDDYDIVVAGYGPVGQMLCALLARAGHRVAAFEKYSQLYGLSRAGHVDDEIMRMMQKIGAQEEFQADTAPWPLLEIRTEGIGGELLMAMDWSQPGRHGWAQHWHMFQNSLEVSIDRQVRASGLVDVSFDTEVTGFEQDDHGVTVTVRGTAGGAERAVHGRHLVGADGANSLVRKSLGITGITQPSGTRQIVIDTREKRTLTFDYDMGMYVNPARPGFLMRMGHSHRRWEFTLHSHETAADFADEGRLWELLAPWVGPDDVEILRAPVYEFRDFMADEWQRDNVFLVGDAAHAMWPFAAEGMCSGMRDASALAWRLDLVLRGLASRSVFDSYVEERKPNVQVWTDISRITGQLCIQTDPDIAAQNIAHMRQWLTDPSTAPAFPAPPGPVVFVRPEDVAAGLAFPQGDVAVSDVAGKFDDLVGTGWVLLVSEPDALDLLDDGQRALLAALNATTAVLAPEGPVVDLAGIYTDWLTSLGAVAVLARPDFHVFGTAASATEVPTLITALADVLAGRGSAEAREREDLSFAGS